ncbi:MAG: GerAB/ArcD/ProY family transporter [Anaerotignaceae bacterium]
MNQKLSIRQLQALTILQTVVVMCIIAPRVAVSKNSVELLAVIVGGVGAVILGSIVVKLNVGNPFESGIGKIVALFFFVKIVYVTGLWLRFFSESIKQILINKTPIFIISGLMVALAIYFAQKGMESRGRVGEIVFGITVLIIGWIFLLALRSGDFNNLKPVTTNNIFSSGSEVLLMVVGFEYLLFHKVKSVKSFVGAGVLAVSLVGLITAVVISVFGEKVTYLRPWAFLQVVDIIDFPLLLLERQDMLISGVWILLSVLFVNGGVMYGGKMASIVGLSKINPVFIYIGVGVLIFYISLTPSGLNTTLMLIEGTKTLNICGLILTFILAFLGRGKK